MNIDDRQELLEEWRSSKCAALVTKPVMYGAGVNMQQCHEAIFVGVGFKFSEFIQAIKRLHRFLQTEIVTIHVIYAESERLILENLMEKWERHKKQEARMSDIIQEFGLSQAAISNELARSLGIERQEVAGESFKLVNNDSVEELENGEPNSVDLVLTSIPFSTQYEYSPSYNDFGHSDSNEHFFEQMDFLTHRLLKVLKPGRLACIHVKDRIVPGGITGLGFQTVYPFHAATIYHFVKHEFGYLGMKTIVTDVVRENNQTYRLGWTEQCKDATKMGVGMPEYLLLFRKPPSDTTNSYADQPVKKAKRNYRREHEIEIEPGITETVPARWEVGGVPEPAEFPYLDQLSPTARREYERERGYSRARWQIDAHGFTRSNGNRPLVPSDLDGVSHATIFKLFRKYSLEHIYDFENHVRLGEHLEKKGILPVTFMLLQPQSWHPDVWTDITRMRTLNGAQSAKGKEMHLCPMQFDLAKRVISQLSEPGEVVYDPFAGLGTVPMIAVETGRRGVGTELSQAYWYDSITYCKAAELKRTTPTLFDMTEPEEESEVLS